MSSNADAMLLTTFAAEQDYTPKPHSSNSEFLQNEYFGSSPPELAFLHP